jgi:hypothetical protein
MNTKLLIALAGLALLVFSGCADSRSQVVREYFDAALAGRSPYDLAGVSGYEIRAYEMVQAAADLVVVRVTYGTRSGLDRVETKKFRLVGGRLQALDRRDIETAAAAAREAEAERTALARQAAEIAAADKARSVDAEQALKVEDDRKARVAAAVAEHRIEIGMTRDDARALLGDPAALRGDAPSEAWIYRDGTVVQFSGPHVASFTDHRQ